MEIDEQKHARAAQNILQTHPSFFKLTWRLQNSPGIMTSGQKQIEILTIHSSEVKNSHFSVSLFLIYVTSVWIIQIFTNVSHLRSLEKVKAFAALCFIMNMVKLLRMVAQNGWIAIVILNMTYLYQASLVFY